MSKKALVITAHPSSQGFTHAIAQAYKRGVESAGGTVEILDLYKTDLKQGFLTFENIRETPTDEAKIAMQKKIAEADELVFIHPLWWMGLPAIMKNWLDVNFSARFAFRYEARKGIWSKTYSWLMGEGKRIPLLKGKTASVFITCDGSIILYLMMALPFWSIWKFATLYYCGIDLRKFKVLDKSTWSSRERKDRFLLKTEAVGRSLMK